MDEFTKNQIIKETDCAIESLSIIHACLNKDEEAIALLLDMEDFHMGRTIVGLAVLVMKLLAFNQIMNKIEPRDLLIDMDGSLREYLKKVKNDEV